MSNPNLKNPDYIKARESYSKDIQKYFESGDPNFLYNLYNFKKYTQKYGVDKHGTQKRMWSLKFYLIVV